jgi:LCP family protein required for cell wall assembly
MFSRLFQWAKIGFFTMVFFSVGVGLCAILLAPEKARSIGKGVQAAFNPVQAAFGKKDDLYILLLGLDYSYDSKAQRHTKDARTDTIMVVRVEPRAKELSMMSVPRDLLVPIAGTGGAYDKINSAYSVGGVKATIKTVEEFTRLKIDHYIVVKSDVVEDLVNELGGVRVKVAKRMDYDDAWARLHIHLKPGEQVLDGTQAVGFLRFRHDEEGDFGRIKRQQQFLTALIRELKGREHWKSYPHLAQVIAKQMKTDLTTDQMIGLASLYRNFPLGSMTKGRPEVADYFGENGIAYLVPVEGEPQATIHKLFPPLPDPDLAGVPVLIEDYRQGERRRLIFINRFANGGFGQVTVRSPANQGKTIEETSLLITGDCPAAEKALPKLFPGVLLFKKASKDAPFVTLRLRDENDIL